MSSAGNRNAAGLVIGAALLMQSFDGQALVTVLPVAARDLSTTPVAISVSLTAYYVGAAVLLPISGWAADRFGARTIFIGSVLSFIACSIWCALANAPGELVLSRALLGAATAGLAPVGRLILVRGAVDARDRVRQLNNLTIPPMVGVLIAPPIAGLLASLDLWRWIFWINVPIGLAGVTMVLRFVPDVRESEIAPLDVLGAALSSVGLALAVYLIDQCAHRRLSADDLWLGAACLGCGIAYVRHARRASSPILDFRLFAIPTFRASVAGGAIFRISSGAEPVLLALLLS